MRIRVSPSSATPFEWEASTAQFRIGRGDTCALRFQGAAGETVSWEHAEIISNVDGSASITDLKSSNGTYVDGARIEAATPLRVGSSIQLGRAGPNLQILSLHAVAAPTPRPISTAPAAAPKSVPVRAVADAPATWFIRHAGSIAAVIVILGLGLALWQRTPSPPAPAVVSPEPPIKPPPAKEREPESAAKVAADAEPVEVREEPATDPWSEARSKALAAFRLLIVEDPQTQAAWPFAGAIVIGGRTLLTTASVATELARFVDRGWVVAVLKPGQTARLPVIDIRAHAAYGQEDASEQLYFDLGIVRTAEPLGAPIELATAGELTELERGLPVICLAVDHAGDPLDRFQQLEPETYVGKVFAVTSLPPQPGGPRLLHVRGSFTSKACGSPILDRQGHLIAVYCEPAPAADSAAEDLRLNYAKIVEPELVELALASQDEKIWARPKVPVTTDNSKESAK